MKNHRKCLMMPVLLAAALCVLAGCRGSIISTTVAPSPVPNVKFLPAENTQVISGVRSAAIFPFADYSHQQDHLGIDVWGGNIKIQEAIADQLVTHGISVVVQEDVNTLLVDYDIIRPIDKNKYLIYGTHDERDETHKIVGSPEWELANYTHSPDMTREILSIIRLERGKKESQTSHTPVLQGATVGMTREKVVDIASALGVDLVFRGRIIDYGYRDIGTINPLYRGFIPVVIDSTKDLLFGATDSYGYDGDLDDIESMLIGGGIGAIIGNNIVNRSHGSRSVISSGLVSRRERVRTSSSDKYPLEGAAIGAAAGWLSAQHPKKAKRSAVVHVRVYAQDGVTGNVVWSNRVEIEYSPRSNFAYYETHPKTMFDNAVREGVKALMDNFFLDAETILLETTEVVRLQKEGA
jgi:hypothetical protein